MKKKIILLLLFATSCCMYGSAGRAQSASSGQSASSTNGSQSVDQDVQLLRQDLRSKKKQLIAANLELTDAEAAKFWPVYDEYTSELSKIGDQKYALIKEYAQGFGSLTDEQALSLTQRSLALDESTVETRNKYVPIFNKVLPGKKTATFFQLDRRISMLIDIQLASELPLVSEQQ
jgi:hypothetical protein